MSNLVGTTIASRFQVGALLGEGRMGRVYRAVDTRLERDVAIKVLSHELCEDARFIARFAREAKIIAQLSTNPHVITIYDIGNLDDGLPFLVTEYLIGRGLDVEMASPTLASRTWVLDVAMQVLSALVDSHAKGVVHRDLKPSNIFVVAAETIPLHVKVLDFGLSRTPNIPMPPELLTQPGALVGTPKYMAPEMFSGDIASPSSDIYSLGLILYELATGNYPYSVNSAAECLRAHLMADPPDFPPSRVPFPSEFEELVLRMLSEESRSRPSGQECFRSVSRVSARIDLEKRQKEP